MKLLSVPTFAKSRSIVLLDLATLESYELKFGKPYQPPAYDMQVESSAMNTQQ